MSRALNRRAKIIGGMFGREWQSPASPQRPPFLANHPLLFVNGRSAIAAAVATCQPAVIWLPSYLCESVVQGVSADGFARLSAAPFVPQFRFYEMDSNLRLASPSEFDELAADDLVIAIDYFGFRFPEEIADNCCDRGAWLLEDACQALLTEGVGELADFSVFSPRKFVGVPDGGLLTRNGSDGNGAMGEWPPSLMLRVGVEDWFHQAQEAFAGRTQFDDDANNHRRDWFAQFREVEQTQPCGNFGMSDLSRQLLEASIDYAFVADRRRANYRWLAERFSEHALFPELPNGVVPLGFPIRLTNRETVRQELFANGIFPPTHWPLDGVVPRRFTASWQLSETLLTLPCDQRLDFADLERMAKVIRAGVTR